MLHITISYDPAKGQVTNIAAPIHPAVCLLILELARPLLLRDAARAVAQELGPKIEHPTPAQTRELVGR